MPSDNFSDIMNGPAMASPLDQTFISPTNRSGEQKWYYICASLTISIAGLFIAVRMYTKIQIVRKKDLSDGAAILAYIGLLAFQAVGRQAVLEGCGVHQWNVQVKRMIKQQYWVNIAMIIYEPTIFLTKFAILRQYQKIFAPQRLTNRFMYYGAWILIIANGVYYTIMLSLTIAACNPREKIWDPFIVGGHCIADVEVSRVTTTCLNIFSDLSILALPLSSVWRLRIPRGKKVGIFCLLALGLLACGCSAGMTVFIFRLRGQNADITYNSFWLGLAASGEMSLGLIVSSTITLPRLYRAKFQSLSGNISKIFGRWSSRGDTHYCLPGSSGKRVDRVFRGQRLSEINLTNLGGDSDSHRDLWRVSTNDVKENALERPKQVHRAF